MQFFQRRFDNIASLEGYAAPQWWRDLLSLWRPSGHDAGKHGLRLAIRNNYLNFYRKGQSIAAVSFANGGLAASLHHKYVADNVEGQEYVKLGADGSLRGKSLDTRYTGIDMLLEWIERAERNHATTEKRAVDEIVSANATIIDLEMGLPGTDERPYAPRMDIVALERAESGAHVVFWEAKMVHDGRIRSRSEPEVFEQLKEYEDFATDDVSTGRNAVPGSYKEVARLLVRFSALAGGAYPLGDLVREVAASQAPLSVDCKPRLIVVKDDRRRDEAAWMRHAQKLVDAGWAPKVLDHGGPYTL